MRAPEANLLSIPCTPAELGELTVATHNRPSVEAAFALRVYRDSYPKALLPWRRKVLTRLSDFGLQEWAAGFGTYGRALDAVTTPGGPGTSNQDLANLRHFAALALESPARAHISHGLGRAREDTALRIALHGLGEVLNSMSPGLQWDGTAIRVASHRAQTVRLNGRRLALYPSFFARGAVVVGSMPNTVAIFFPHPMPRSVVDSLNGNAEDRVRSDAVASLLGRTRANALEVLTVPRSTGELADALGICQAGASKHASTLRRAGLVATNAIRNRRVHVLTSRGAALLFGDLEETFGDHAVSTPLCDRTLPA